MNARPTQKSPSIRRPSAPNWRGRAWVALPFTLGALALTAACTPYASSTASSTAPVPAAPPAGTVIASASTAIGTILVNSAGRTLYDFANDTGSMSTCNGGCAQTWLPVTAPSMLPASLPGVPAAVGATTRSDGTRQLTVAGHPVYTFAGDTGRGQTNGNGIQLNGGLWTVVSPTGSSLSAVSSSTGTGY